MPRLLLLHGNNHTETDQDRATSGMNTGPELRVRALALLFSFFSETLNTALCGSTGSAR